MLIYAPAKVNLALDVVRKLDNGYHELDMIMAPVSLYDEVQLEANGTDEDIIICESLPANSTIHKAMAVLRKDHAVGGYTIQVTKRIPVQAGLAGGSADAAAVLRGVNELEGLGLTQEELDTLGLEVGADVPFCLHSVCSRVKGVGEKVYPLSSVSPFEMLLVKPEAGVSTPEAFAWWDGHPKTYHDVDLVQTALETGCQDLLYCTMANALEPAGFALAPELDQVRQDMQDLGIVRVMMTGSGSGMMGFSVDKEVLESAARQLKDKYPFVQVVQVGV